MFLNMAEFTPGSPDLSTPDLSDPRALMERLDTLDPPELMALTREIMKQSQNPTLRKINDGKLSPPALALRRLLRGELMEMAEKMEKKNHTSATPYAPNFALPGQSHSSVSVLGFQSATAARIILEG